jgi:hypothetical protein
MRINLLLTFIWLSGCSTSVTQETESLEGAQRVFFPDRYEYSVGDFVLALPIGYYETAMHRLAFAQKIIETGSPKPVLEQQKYLVLEADALAPKRHFLLLDQRHLLIYSEYFELEEGSPPQAGSASTNGRCRLDGRHEPNRAGVGSIPEEGYFYPRPLGNRFDERFR